MIIANAISIPATRISGSCKKSHFFVLEEDLEKVPRDKAKTITKINMASLDQPDPGCPGRSTPKVAIVDIARKTAKIGSPLTNNRDKAVTAVIKK